MNLWTSDVNTSHDILVEQFKHPESPTKAITFSQRKPISSCTPCSRGCYSLLLQEPWSRRAELKAEGLVWLRNITSRPTIASCFELRAPWRGLCLKWGKRWVEMWMFLWFSTALSILQHWKDGKGKLKVQDRSHVRDDGVLTDRFRVCSDAGKERCQRTHDYSQKEQWTIQKCRKEAVARVIYLCSNLANIF